MSPKLERTFRVGFMAMLDRSPGLGCDGISLKMSRLKMSTCLPPWLLMAMFSICHGSCIISALLVRQLVIERVKYVVLSISNKLNPGQSFYLFPPMSITSKTERELLLSITCIIGIGSQQ